MASMLELPRELYLMICSLLRPTDLTRLARVSRDHYLAVQHPLFGHVKVYSFDSLVKLLRTVVKVPIVSHISAKQRRYWHKLSDAELRERDIRSLHIALDCHKDIRIVGAIVERCVGGIVHKCPDVAIHMTLYSIWRDGIKQLAMASLPNVRRLEVFASGRYMDSANIEALRTNMWDLVFSGVTFPDLQDVYLNTSRDSAEEPPSTSVESLNFHDRLFDSAVHNETPDQTSASFHGVVQMQKIRLEHNKFLTPAILNSLFNSNIIPKRLTTLEIVNCTQLHPTRHLCAIAVLLGRSLQLLQSLKLHLTGYYPYNHEYQAPNYNAEIDEHPEYHLCNVIREAGQNIQSLDLALPYACNRMLIPRPKKNATLHQDQQDLPTISLEPANTLSQRVLAEGYRYRRLHLYSGICRGAHDWDDMVALAVDQQGDFGWELLSEPEDRAVWCVSGCAPVECSFEEAMARR